MKTPKFLAKIFLIAMLPVLGWAEGSRLIVTCRSPAHVDSHLVVDLFADEYDLGHLHVSIENTRWGMSDVGSYVCDESSLMYAGESYDLEITDGVGYLINRRDPQHISREILECTF